jgi:hypothetical protein
MNPENLSLLIQGIAAGVLACIPVYQKWRSVERAETVADREAGVLKDRALVETVKSWEFWTCSILAVICLLAILDSYATSRKGLEIIQALERQITDYRATAQADRTRIEAIEMRVEGKLDGVIARLNTSRESR